MAPAVALLPRFLFGLLLSVIVVIGGGPEGSVLAGMVLIL